MTRRQPPRTFVGGREPVNKLHAAVLILLLLIGFCIAVTVVGAAIWTLVDWTAWIVGVR